MRNYWIFQYIHVHGFTGGHSKSVYSLQFSVNTHIYCLHTYKDINNLKGHLCLSSLLKCVTDIVGVKTLWFPLVAHAFTIYTPTFHSLSRGVLNLRSCCVQSSELENTQLPWQLSGDFSHGASNH